MKSRRHFGATMPLPRMTNPSLLVQKAESMGLAPKKSEESVRRRPLDQILYKRRERAG